MVSDPAGPNSKVDNVASGRLQRFGARAVKEIRLGVVLFLYLWVLFGLFVLNQRIILHQQGINFTAQGFAVINAAVLAKVMLIAENLDLGRWLQRRPLIYPILHDALLFTILFICFHVVEKLGLGLIHGESLAASVPAIGGGGPAGLICVAAILFFGLIPYFAFRNVGRVLGPDRLNAMLFGPASSGQPITDK